MGKINQMFMLNLFQHVQELDFTELEHDLHVGFMAAKLTG
jgi:hypothetical protein